LLTICRYNFNGFITDQSATAPLTFFTPATDEVTGYTCEELLAIHNGEDPQLIPPQIFELEGQKNIFQFHFSQTSKKATFVLDQVFNKRNVTKESAKSIELQPGSTIFVNTLSCLKIKFLNANIYSFSYKNYQQ
jgi:hypothetical protein